MLHLAFREKLCGLGFFYNQKANSKQKWASWSEKGSNLCNSVWPFGLHLLHEPAAKILLCSSQSCCDGLVSSSHLTKELKISTVLLFCILQADFKLMCDNAMTYNRPDTVYYKLAKKILHTGFKMMSKVRELLKTKSRNSSGGWGWCGVVCCHT